MSEAPERIWGYPSHVTGWNSAIAHDRPIINSVEFARADLVEAAVKRAIEACAEASGNLRGRDVPKRDAEDTGQAYDLAIYESQSAIRALAQDPEAIAKIIGDK